MAQVERRIQVLLRTRRALETRLGRIEEQIRRNQQQPLDEAEVEVQTDEADRLREDLREWENDILQICPDDTYDEHAQASNGLMTRLNVAKASLIRIDNARAAALEQQRQPAGNNNSEGQRRGVKLPRLDLPKFNGNILEWTSFRDRFVAAIHNDRNMPNCDKLSYLMSCLTDDAAKVLKAMQVTDDNYNEAWDILTRKYQNVREIAFMHARKLMNFQVLKEESASGLTSLVDTANETVRSLRVLGVQVENCDLFLDVILLDKVDSETRKQWHLGLRDDAIPRFQDLLDFLDTRARALSVAKPQEHVSKQKQNNANKTAHVGTQKPCPDCNEIHHLSKCDKFKKRSLQDRREFVKTKNICFRCLNPGHSAKNCNSKSNCRECNKRHHTLVHSNEAPTASTSAAAPVASSSTSSTMTPAILAPPSTLHVMQPEFRDQTLLATAVILVRDKHGKEHRVRALLDNGSQMNFITEDCLQRLSLPRVREYGTVSGIGDSGSLTANGHVKLQFRSHFYDFAGAIDALVLTKITSVQPQYPVNKDAWPHLKELPLADPRFHVPADIDVLLGGDVFMEVIRESIIRGPEGSPKALLTVLGWVIGGGVQYHRISGAITLLSCCQLEKYVKFLWEAESVPEGKVMSLAEKQCEEHYRLTHTRDSSGRYVVRLPFKDNGKSLGDSRQLALRRFMQTERRLSKNPEHKLKYDAVLQEYLDLKHMEEVPYPELKKDPAKVYYMPHHGVIKESSTTTKLRVVFDASAKTTSGVSLNDQLMIGPTIQNDLFSILVRVRKHQIMFSSDAEKMYRMVRCHPEDCDYQRILWRKDANSPIKEYRLLTVTFGVASAPFQAIRTLHQIAEDEAVNYPMAVPVVKNDFYVDDCISGSDTLEDALEVQQQLMCMLEKGGFLLRKWASSHPALLEALPSEMRETKLPLDLNPDSTIKALGIQWHPALDAFKFNVKLPKVPATITKRYMLSELSKVFDPLGWISPVTIRGKIMFQSLWYHPIDWDDPVPTEVEKAWRSYAEHLLQLSELKISRCITVKNVNVCELFCFSDASTQALAAVVYMKTTNHAGETKVCNVAAKTRVRPKKATSLPRLELMAAVLLARLTKAIVAALHMKIESIHAFTDSSIVLAWVKGSADRWCTFVANRVAEIQDTLHPSFWHHVPGGENPADCASRGVTTTELLEHSLWWSAPPWVYTGELPELCVAQPADEELEMKRGTAFAGACVNANPILERFSSFMALIRFTAYALRFRKNCKLPKDKRITGFLTTPELRAAEMCWVQLVQQEHFAEELEVLMRGSGSAGSTKIKSKAIRVLYPILDSDGVMRVGGRLEHAAICYDRKHPVLLPKKSRFTLLLIQYEHGRTMHGGPLLMLTSLQRRYWVIGAKDLARRVSRECLRCYRLKADSAKQLMASLPLPRVNSSRPFSVCGLDYTGPFMLKTFNNKSSYKFKAYIAIFTCFSTKAVHFELVSSLTTAKCIEAIQRFCDTRSRPVRIQSDNGRNLVGARRELNELRQLVQSKEFHDDVTKALAANNIEWLMNPPYSPHYGGLWEAGIKSMKFHLKRVIGNKLLNYEAMLTVMKRAEACMNSQF